MFLLHFLFNLLQRPRPPYVALIQKTPGPRYGGRRPAMIYQAPHHYSTRFRWLPSPFYSRQRKRGIRIHVHPVSPAFPFPGTGKPTRCLGGTRYQEYPFNNLLFLIGSYVTHADSLFDTHALWTFTCRLVFALHFFSPRFPPHAFLFCGFNLYRVRAHMKLWKCIILDLTTRQFNVSHEHE